MNDGTAYFVMPLAALVIFLMKIKHCFQLFKKVVNGPCSIKTLWILNVQTP